MIILDRVATRMGRFSVRLLSIAIVCEIGGATAILLLWPHLWPIGVILIAFASTRLWSLAMRFRAAATGPIASLYLFIQWGALASAVLALAFLIFGLLAIALGGGWV